MQLRGLKTLFEYGERVRYIRDDVRPDDTIPWGAVGTVIVGRKATYDGMTEVNFDLVKNPPAFNGWMCSNESLELVVEIDSVLDIAKKICYGDRNIDYGDPYDDYVKTAKLFSIVLGSEVKPHQAAMMMICVKLSRLMHDPTKRDSIVDVAGYADVLDRIVKREFEL